MGVARFVTGGVVTADEQGGDRCQRGLQFEAGGDVQNVARQAVLGHDPVIMLEAPIPATQRALEKAGINDAVKANQEQLDAFLAKRKPAFKGC